MHQDDKPFAFYPVAFLQLLAGIYSLLAAADLLLGLGVTEMMRPFQSALLHQWNLAVLLGSLAFLSVSYWLLRGAFLFVTAEDPPTGETSDKLSWLAIVAAFHVLDTGPMPEQLWDRVDYVVIGLGVLSIPAAAYLKVYGQPASRREERMLEESDDLIAGADEG